MGLLIILESWQRKGSDRRRLARGIYRVISSVTSRVTEKVKEKVKDKLDNTSLELLKLIIEDPGYNYSYLSKRLGISTKTISIRFKKLQQAGIVERVCSDRKGYWKVIER